MRFLRPFPFPITLCAIGTLVFFQAMAALPASGVQAVLLGFARILIIPAYAAILGATILLHAVTGGRLTGTTASLAGALALCVALLPFVAADWFVRRQLKKRR